MIKHEETRCEKVRCMGHTPESQVESKSGSRNDSSSKKEEEELIEEKNEKSLGNANSSSNAKLEGSKFKLIGIFVKSKCGLQQRSTNKDVAPSTKPPTKSERRRTKLPLQHKLWNNNRTSNTRNHRRPQTFIRQPVTSSC